MKIILLCICVFFTTLTGYCASENNEVYLPTQLTTTSSWNYDFYFNAPFLPPASYRPGWELGYKTMHNTNIESLESYILSNTYFLAADIENMVMFPAYISPIAYNNSDKNSENPSSSNKVVALPDRYVERILIDYNENCIGYVKYKGFIKKWQGVLPFVEKENHCYTRALINKTGKTLYIEKPQGHIEADILTWIPHTNHIDVVWYVITLKNSFFDKTWGLIQNVLEIKYGQLDPVKWQWIGEPVTVLTHDPNKEKVSKYESHYDLINGFACHIQDDKFIAFFYAQFTQNNFRDRTLGKYYWLNTVLRASNSKQKGTLTCIPVCNPKHGDEYIKEATFYKNGKLHIILSKSHSESADYLSGRPIEYCVYKNSNKIYSNKLQMPSIPKELITKYRNLGSFTNPTDEKPLFMYYDRLKDAHIIFDKQDNPYLLYISYEEIKNKLHAVIRTLKLNEKTSNQILQQTAVLE